MAEAAPPAPDPVATTPERVKPEDITAVRLRHPIRWVAAIVVLYIVVALAYSLVTNANYDWGVVWQYLFSAPVMKGLGLTLVLTVVSMLIGIVLGVILAIMRRSENPMLSGTAWVYIWLFRGTPVYVQLLFWGAIGSLYPFITLAVPFGGPDLIHVDANTLITPFLAAVLGLALNEAAYMAEVVRGGLLSVDEGQTEAASALGMTSAQTLRRIVLPQAMRVIIPPTGNETISMLKTTSLVSVLAFSDLLYATHNIAVQNYKTISLLIVASIWYLLFTSIMQTGQFYIERYYGRGTARVQQETLLQNIRRRMFTTSREESGTGPKA
ncbi:MAG: amino acid ABC transporter permease [Solirubrobacteraceae bacterium]|nr:amino acid ABC transporter permease [Patulibacter sp.]